MSKKPNFPTPVTLRNVVLYFYEHGDVYVSTKLPSIDSDPQYIADSITVMDFDVMTFVAMEVLQEMFQTDSSTLERMEIKIDDVTSILLSKESTNSNNGMYVNPIIISIFQKIFGKSAINGYVIGNTEDICVFNLHNVKLSKSSK